MWQRNTRCLSCPFPCLNFCKKKKKKIFCSMYDGWTIGCFILKDDESKQYTGDGSVDFKGRPVLKRNTGNWKACPFILGKFFSFLLCLKNSNFFLLIAFLCNMNHRQWVLWTFGVLWHCDKSRYLSYPEASWRKCLCCKKCHHLARHLLSCTSHWSCFGRCLLGTILDNCHFLHHLFHSNY